MNNAEKPQDSTIEPETEGVNQARPKEIEGVHELYAEIAQSALTFAEKKLERRRKELAGLLAQKSHLKDPTLSEEVDQKINWHKRDIEGFELIAEKTRSTIERCKGDNPISDFPLLERILKKIFNFY